MDLAAPHDDVLTQKDQANAVFLLHGYGLGAWVESFKKHPARLARAVFFEYQLR
jgi:hypothetical protein